MRTKDALLAARSARALFACAALTGLAALSARALPLGDGETATAGSSDYEITGNVTFGEGTYSGKITGTGTAIIETGSNAKHCVFTNPANTYSGGTIISNASWKVNETGATGSGKITISLSGKSFFRPESNATLISNEIEVVESSSTVLDYASIMMPKWHNVTFTGGIRSHGTLVIQPTSADNRGGAGTGGTTVYDCDVRCCAKDDGSSWQHIYPRGFGTNIFRKAVVCNRLHMGDWSSETGWYEIHSSSNQIDQLRIYNGRLTLFAKDVSPFGTLVFNNAGTSSGRSLVDLRGNDQTFRAIGDINVYTVAREAGRKCLTSSTPARVTVNGRDGSYDMNAVEWKLEGAVSFCLDVPPSTWANFSMGFSYSEHSTSGDLVVSNGTLNILNGAKMPKVGRIVVATNGHLVVQSGAVGAFAACSNLVVEGEVRFTDDSAMAFSQQTLSIELGENAKLTLPASETLTVNSLSVGGVPKAKGTYSTTEIPQLLGGTLNVVPPVADADATWTGGGESDESVSTAANWSTAPTLPALDSGSLLATFASGGERAALGDDDISLRGIVFGGVAGGVGSFAIAGADRTVSVKSPGVTVAGAADGNEHLWTVGPRVEYLDAAAQTFDIPEGHTLDLAGGVKELNAFVNTKTGAGTLKIGGSTYVVGSYRLKGGAAEFSGEAQIVGGVYVTNTTLTVRGRVSSLGSGVADTRDPGYSFNLNPTYAVTVDARLTADMQHASSSLVLDGATVDSPFQISGPGNKSATPYSVRTNWLVFAENSTNAFNSYARFSSPLGCVHCGPDSETTFNYRLHIGGECRFSNPVKSRPATINFASPNKTFDRSSGGGPIFEHGLILNCSGTNNWLRDGKYYYQMALSGDDSKVNFLNDDFFSFGSVASGGARVLVDLGSTHQRVWWYTGTYSGRLTGSEGSELEISHSGYFTSYLKKAYTVDGAVSLRMRSQDCDYKGLTQDGAFTNFVAVASTGNITVDSGTLRFSANGTWTNAGTVTVNGGRLELANNKAFGRKTKVVLTGGKVMLDYAADARPLRVRELWVGPDADHLVRMPPGVYSAASVPAESGLAAADWFEGTGRLAVRGGFVLLLK